MTTAIEARPVFYADPNHTLDDLLLDASKLGECSLHRLGAGWSFKVSVATSHTGTEFNVRSDFNHANPRAAVVECLGRAYKAIADVAGRL